MLVTMTKQLHAGQPNLVNQLTLGIRSNLKIYSLIHILVSVETRVRESNDPKKSMICFLSLRLKLAGSGFEFKFKLSQCN